MSRLSAWVSKARNKHQAGIFLNILYELYVRAYTWPLGRVFLSLLMGRVNSRLPDRQVFLIGCYNSGTTILRDILRAHPDVSGMPREGVRFTNVFPDMQQGGWVRMAYKNREMPASNASSAQARKQLDRDWGYWSKSKNGVFLEKSITHSYRLEFLQRTFPAAKFILISRDGYCSTEGVLRRAAPQGSAVDQVGSEYSAGLCAEQWVSINTKLLAAKNNANTTMIRFEDFVSKPYETVSDLLAFIGVDTAELKYEGKVLQVGLREFEIRNPNPASRGRFPKAQLKAFNSVASEMMHKLGYSIMSESDE